MSEVMTEEEPSERCTKEIIQRFSNAVHLFIKPHVSNSSMDFGNLEEVSIDALSIDLFNSRGYIRFEVLTNDNILLQAAKDDVIKCYASVLYEDKMFMEGPLVDLQVLQWSKERTVIQVDIDLTMTHKEWNK